MKTTAVFALLLATAVLATAAPAQTGCYNFGSTPVAARWEASAVPLGCSLAPTWPQWHLFTPGHRAPGPHLGYNPGNAHRLPRILVTYRCTGFLFVPVVIHRVRLMGFVVDQPEIECAIDR